MLILELSIVNTYAEIIDRFRLLNNVQVNNMFVYYTNSALYSETPINIFDNIQNIVFYEFCYITPIYHTVPIYSGWNSDTITLIIYNLCGFC